MLNKQSRIDDLWISRGDNRKNRACYWMLCKTSDLDKLFGTSIYLSMALQPFVGPWPLFQFLDLFTQSVGPLGRGICPSQGRYQHIEQHKHRKKRTQTSMPWVGFELTIPVFERARTFHNLDRAATAIGVRNDIRNGKWTRRFEILNVRSLYIID
jgi:hypothetical protein